MKINIRNVYEYVVILGSFTVCVPVGVLWIYGNLSSYLLSYFIYVVGPDAFDIDPGWLLASYVAMSTLSLVTVDWCVKKIGPCWTHVVSMLCFDLSLFLTYFTVQVSVGLTLVTFMMMSGFATGQIVMVSFIYASKVMPKHVGAATAFISSGFGLGAVFINAITTAFINPDNLSPDVRKANMAYFSQPHVLHRVPGVFLVFGVIAFGLHLLGFLLETLPLYLILYRSSEKEVSKESERTTLTYRHVDGYDAGKHDDKSTHTDESVVHYEINGKDNEQIDKVTSPIKIVSLKPLEVLCTKSFYQVWISVFIMSFSNLLVQNFYKLFGQLWIKDDSFLASMGSTAAIVMSVYRIVVGVVMDKIGVKDTIVLTLFLNTVLMAFWYVTPRVHQWFYFIYYQVLAAVQGSTFTVFPIAAVKLFGPLYYASNYGLLMTSNVVVGVVSPLVYPIILEKIGWLGLILVSPVASLLVVISLVIVMPSDSTNSSSSL